MSFLDELDENPNNPIQNLDNSMYMADEKLLGDLLVGEFDILEVIMQRFNMSMSGN